PLGWDRGYLAEHGLLVGVVAQLVVVAGLDVHYLTRIERHFLALVDAADGEVALPAQKDVLRARMAVHLVAAMGRIHVESDLGSLVFSQPDAGAVLLRLRIRGDARHLP